MPNRRHTIVGCHQDDDEGDADDLGDDMEAAAKALANAMDGSSDYAMGPPPPPPRAFRTGPQVNREKENADVPVEPEETDERLSLTLEEIVHIRSVMTKAELEGLPIEVRIKEDVEKRKVRKIRSKRKDCSYLVHWLWEIAHSFI